MGWTLASLRCGSYANDCFYKGEIKAPIQISEHQEKASNLWLMRETVGWSNSSKGESQSIRCKQQGTSVHPESVAERWLA